MTKYETVARWLSAENLEGTSEWKLRNKIFFDTNKEITNYNLLHEAWVKFRDLKFDFDLQFDDSVTHSGYINRIAVAIIFGTKTEAFDELVKGIEWYNNLNK